MTDLRRTIIILMAVACIVDVIGVIHCHINNPYLTNWYAYQTSHSIIFPILLSLTGFLLLEQILITDGTIAPLNRLRIVYAFAAAVALIIFGISAAIFASRWHTSYGDQTHFNNALVAAIIAFIGAAIYIAEAVMRNRKSGIV